MSHTLRLPKSIYSRTLVLVGLVTFLLQILTFVIFFRQMVLPNVQVQVEQFVDGLELVTQYPDLLREPEQVRWGGAEPEGEDEFSGFISPPRGLEVKPASWRIPFWSFVDDELEYRFGEPITMWQSHLDQTNHPHDHYWLDLPLQGSLEAGEGAEEIKTIRVGFSADREGCLNPPVLFLVLVMVVTITLISVYFLTRWLVQPINELRGAVGEMGMGEYPDPLPEKGPTEFLSLVTLFNWMVGNIKRMVENRSTMLAGLSHDLKTPLARMRLSTEMLSREQDPDLVEGIEEDLDVMDVMVEDALEFARGGRKGREEEIDLNDVIDEVVERKRRGGMVVNWIRGSLPCVRVVDPSALHRILSNYLENAVRYGGGKIPDVQLHCGYDGVFIVVLDRGVGIPEEDLERVFDPFFRSEKSRSREQGGSGLGLAIVRNLAEVNGWKAELKNRPGGGAIASLRFP